LREEIARLKGCAPPAKTRVVLISYQPTAEEAGSERPFDFSSASVQQRWRSGEADMERACHLVSSLPEEEMLIGIRSLTNGSVGLAT
jgi:Patatin phospholipase